jgi:hypothetical protein
MSEDRFIEVDGATLEIRDDGRVGVYSPSGFQIVEVSELPEPLAKLVKDFQS